MRRGEAISIILTVVLIGIPSAVRFYPPLFADLAGMLPLDRMVQGGILTLGIIIGWFTRGFWEDDRKVERTTRSEETNSSGITSHNENTTSPEEITEIEGCIEVEGSCWRGTAKITDGEISEVEVPYKAICPKCQTIMYDASEGPPIAVAGGGPSYWDCPQCDHKTIDEYSKYDNAKKLFKSHVRRIVESEGEDYSLQNLINDIEDEAPRRVWEKYAQMTDDDQVSLNCFH